MNAIASLSTDPSQILAEASKPVLGALAEPTNRIVSAIDAIDTDGITDAAEAVVAPVRRNPRRVVTALAILGSLGLIVFVWQRRRRGADEVPTLPEMRAAA